MGRGEGVGDTFRKKGMESKKKRKKSFLLFYPSYSMQQPRGILLIVHLIAMEIESLLSQHQSHFLPFSFRRRRRRRRRRRSQLRFC